MIFVSGTLDGKFARKATGTADWAEARRIAEVYEQADSWTGQPKPKPTPVAQMPAPEKTRITVEDACKVFVTNRESAGVAPATLRLKLVIVDDGRIVLPIARFNEFMLHCGRPLVSPWFFDYFFKDVETLDQFESAVERFASYVGCAASQGTCRPLARYRRSRRRTNRCAVDEPSGQANVTILSL